ncbi:hypothetical protein BSPWISOXPB_16 [uncultured Gammaproteobacteria bacterium]|nr:hypothetical protein BSPWISOXPB_16 [uncultured Gammaproteobacteria bacterium]
MKNKSILAIMPATAIGFVNAGIFDDIGNGIAGATNDVSDFTVDAAEDVADVALDGLKIIDETITGDWVKKIIGQTNK